MANSAAQEQEPDWDSLRAAARAEARYTPSIWTARNTLAVQQEIWDPTNRIGWARVTEYANAHAQKG